MLSKYKKLPNLFLKEYSNVPNDTLHIYFGKDKSFFIKKLILTEVYQHPEYNYIYEFRDNKGIAVMNFSTRNKYLWVADNNIDPLFINNELKDFLIELIMKNLKTNNL